MFSVNTDQLAVNSRLLVRRQINQTCCGEHMERVNGTDAGDWELETRAHIGWCDTWEHGA